MKNKGSLGLMCRKIALCKDIQGQRQGGRSGGKYQTMQFNPIVHRKNVFEHNSMAITNQQQNFQKALYFKKILLD